MWAVSVKSVAKSHFSLRRCLQQGSELVRSSSCLHVAFSILGAGTIAKRRSLLERFQFPAPWGVAGPRQGCCCGRPSRVLFGKAFL